MKIIIVGAVAGGASAAARARRLSEEAEIILFERGHDPSFANCGLPYYIGGEIAERQKLLVAPKELLQQRFRLDVRTRTEVVSIDRENKTVTARDLETDLTSTESYDKLILSPGAKPFVPPVPGSDLPGVYTLRDLQDADRLLKIVTGDAKRAVIIGGGFIGLEMAENLIKRGIETTLLELGDQIMPPLDKEITQPILRTLKEKGVLVRLCDTNESIEATEQGLRVTFKSGDHQFADFVLLSVGVRPENSLAVDAGLEIGPRGGIKVNKNMQTADPDIYAVGDAVETYEFITKEPTQVPLAGPANRQGRLAAEHIFGRTGVYRGTQGTAIVGLFGMSAAMTGFSEKAARRFDVPYEKVYIHPAHHAGYYPGAQGMTLKLLFSPEDGKILGAQGVGGAGVDKRIDIIAMAIQAGMTVYDLEEVELSYAPQFGSAKDPVNMLGFVASGVLRKDQPIVHADQLNEDVWKDALLLDVRTPAEFESGHIKGAVNIPVDDLRNRINEIPAEQTVIAYCKVGMRGYLATRILLQNNRKAFNLSGGYTTWDLMHSDG